MSSERFTVQGATGVDVNLALAGPGSRSYAFVIDWHIRVLLALAWLIVGMLIVSGSLTWRGVKAGGLSALLVAAPALILYFLYHPIVEVFMHGQTPGKRIAGVRVVSRDGGIPGFGAIMIRNIFRLVDSLPAFYAVGLATTFVSAQRIRIGDMAAGTLLVFEDKPAAQNFIGLAGDGRAITDLAATDLAAQILDRWPQLAVEKRESIARALLERTAGPEGAGRAAGLRDEALKSALAALVRRTSAG